MYQSAIEGDSIRMSDSKDLAFAARSLISQAIEYHDELYGFGSFSRAIYDTAWVSMVAKQDENGRHWLFPQCFHHILDSQHDDGTWGPKASQADAILNTAASLMTLQAHLEEPLQIQEVPLQELQKRIALASAALQSHLRTWDVTSSTHVGFEVIIPAVLNILERKGIAFGFPSRKKLEQLNAAKMSKFQPQMLYSQHKSTMLHSLETLISKIDYDRVGHHKVSGAIMASPSASAAYLIHASQWDEEVESYLRHVVGRYGGIGVPSAYPSTYFEYTWLLSTFLTSGFTAEDCDGPSLNRMVDIITKGFQSGNGVIGFARGLEPDADDTAKGLISLILLKGENNNPGIDPSAMIAAFETDTHFQTYLSERNPSFTTNCNVLLALLHSPEPTSYLSQISKIVRFLCTYWWESDDNVEDKWNLSHLYPTMLLVQALAQLLSLIDSGVLTEAVDDDDIRNRISITVFQACFWTLLCQQEDGAWGSSVEQTSYGILVLTQATRLPLFHGLAEQLAASIDSATRFITATPAGAKPLDYIWIEKVTYGSAYLTELYRLAALKSAETLVRTSAGQPENRDESTPAPSQMKMMSSYVQLFGRTQLFAGTPEWQLRGSYLEAALFRTRLLEQRLATFPRTGMAEDRYFDIIPFTWTACNNRTRTRARASPAFLLEMMQISFVNYQADEHMEAVAGPAFADDLGQLRHIIDAICHRYSSYQDDGQDDPHIAAGCSPAAAGGLDIDIANKMALAAEQQTAVDPLLRFVKKVLRSPRIVAASPPDRRDLATELRIFLQAHVTQHADNSRFRQQQQLQPPRARRHAIYQDPQDPFSRWVRTTSADHTSCPYSFAYATCLLSSSSPPPPAPRQVGGGEGDCFPAVAEKYFAAAVCRHLATMCRMYNDYGSIRRDAAERNLNSVNFPEFRGGGRLEEGEKKGPKKTGEEEEEEEDLAKAQLFKLAAFERACLDQSLASLASELQARGADQRRKLAVFRLFCDVTDLYGQLYVVKDLASSMKVATGGDGIHRRETA